MWRKIEPKKYICGGKWQIWGLHDPDLFDSLFEVHVPLLNEEGQCQSGGPEMAALSALAHYPPLRLQPLRAEVFILSCVNHFFWFLKMWFERTCLFLPNSWWVPLMPFQNSPHWSTKGPETQRSIWWVMFIILLPLKGSPWKGPYPARTDRNWCCHHDLITLIMIVINYPHLLACLKTALIFSVLSSDSWSPR